MKTLGLKRKILEVKDLHVHFYTYAGVVKAISGVSFEIYEGETFCLVGETGCGKSVTSRAITKLIESPGKIVKGQVLFYRDGSPIDLLKLSDEELRRIRGREIAYIFQDPTAALDPLYSVGYQIAETMVAHNTATWKEAFRRAVDILKSVLIPDPEKRVKNYPHELSGGMKQRVVIGISLSNKPKLLIADEPTTAVDVTIQAQILDLLRKLRQEEKMTLLLITHNMGVVAEMCDRVAVMYAGKIVEIGTVHQIFKNPQHPYTKGLLKAVPNPLIKIEKLESIPGTVPNLIFPPSGCRFHPRCPRKLDICDKKEPPLIEVEEGHKVACWLYVK
ncbi:MAG: ABC transporter ATP-binding protein [Thermoprotei archaeon]|nr:ABC transporter ATP-binding protein [Thermoprotei archaeon]